jgi:predicted DNA-binding transcriptional regulator AlpA
MKPLLITARQCAELLGMSLPSVYELASDGGPLERRYIGKGTRNFRITYESVEQYVAGLSSEPVEEAS